TTLFRSVSPSVACDWCAAVLQSAYPTRSLVPERLLGRVAPSALRGAESLPCGVNGACRRPGVSGPPCRSHATGPGPPAPGAPRCTGRLAGAALSAALRQLVPRIRLHGDAGLLGERLPLQLAELALQFPPHASQRDPEHALAALQQVHDLVGGGAFVDADPVAHQRDVGEISGGALSEVLDRGADLLQRDPRVEQPFNDFEDEDVAEAVQPMRRRAAGHGHTGLDQLSTSPVVELAIRDSRCHTGGGTTVSDVHRQPHYVLVTQQAFFTRPSHG